MNVKKERGSESSGKERRLVDFPNKIETWGALSAGPEGGYWFLLVFAGHVSSTQTRLREREEMLVTKGCSDAVSEPPAARSRGGWDCDVFRRGTGES